MVVGLGEAASTLGNAGAAALGTSTTLLAAGQEGGVRALAGGDLGQVARQVLGLPTGVDTPVQPYALGECELAAQPRATLTDGWRTPTTGVVVGNRLARVYRHLASGEVVGGGTPHVLVGQVQAQPTAVSLANVGYAPLAGGEQV